MSFAPLDGATGAKVVAVDELFFSGEDDFGDATGTVFLLDVGAGSLGCSETFEDAAGTVFLEGVGADSWETFLTGGDGGVGVAFFTGGGVAARGTFLTDF